MGQKVRVGLVYGGRSGEHEVSLQTALAVLKSFDYDKYELIPFYITKTGQWRSGPLLEAPPSAVAELQFQGATADAGGSAEGKLVLTGAGLAPLLQGMSEQVLSAEGAAADHRAIDVMFPLLHGTFGEDGTIQGLFEMAGLPYVGAGVLASAVGMDKAAMKTMFAQAGLPQVGYRYFTRYQWNKDQEGELAGIEESLGYPCFVKPANLGSSVGVSKARDRAELTAAIREALRYDRKVIVEEFVDAREIEVSVLGNDDPRASVPGEIVSSNEFYDYKAKYIDGKSIMEIPAEIPPETAQTIREMAVRAFLAIDGSGLCRADFFLRRSDGAIFINEVNTMPGFTPFSMYPLMWKETGVSYAELLDALIRLAIERHEEKQAIDYGSGN
ncbi:D-alanine--D-alanine ligase [Cohnella thailandensis]|uniref:D-alanine--D-alanine ligase n=1 Tax=Cohnella thailandensis TaxID=557557 RepID=A0A841T9V0_9BACL|nr:D-alanine--D-alanine ligase [Cohnella thailandensis]MBB6637991.1 D-alanine--D-alanine ligase [Cohnella thailandensis]MBP1976870.1 D-alanine-D-alanine ligase [Cohnella thailandensis]